MKTKEKSLQSIMNTLSARGHGMGTDKLYRRLNHSSVYTDGFKGFLEIGEAQWLYDIIETEFFIKLKKRDEPDKYYLTLLVDDNKAVLSLKNYKDTLIHRRKIKYTDLPDGEVLFYVAWMEYPNPDGEGFKYRMTTCLPIED